MPKYEITVCDGESCGIVGTARDPEVAKRKLTRELKRRGKKFRKAKVPVGMVRGEVREVVRGIPADKALYEGEERYGEPVKRRQRRPQRSEDV